MATHGSIGPFEPKEEDWTSYTERLEQYFTANDVEDAGKQRAILLSVCGAATYKLIRSLLHPEKPTSKSFDDLVKLVKDHHQPTPLESVQRYNFNTRKQKEGETIAEYVAELRRLSEHCNFGATLDEMLRDRLMCGTWDKRIRHRLLAETKKLSFKELMQLALAIESADRNSKELQTTKPPTGEASVYQVRRQRNPSQTGKRPTATPTCHRCGAGSHLAKDCKFKDAECYHCKKVGHLARVCRSRKREGGQRVRRTHQLAEDQSEDSSTYSLFRTSTRDKPKPLLVTMLVNEKELQLEVDTGASASVISESTYRELWPEDPPKLLETQVKLQTYTGEKIKILGSIKVKVEYEQQKQMLGLLVVAGPGPSLMGRDWLTKIRLNWAGMLNKISTPQHTLQEVLQKHTSVFQEELGLISGTTAKIYIEEDAEPKFFKARTIPYALRDRVNKEMTD